VTELVVVLFLSFVGLGVVAYLVRWLLALPSGEPDMARVAGLVRDTADTFVRRQSGTMAALGALVGGALFLAYGLRTSVGDPVNGLELGVWVVVSFAIGTTAAVALGQAATYLATRGATRTASAARRSVDAALRASTRAGTAMSLLATALSTLTMGVLYLAVLAYHGALGSDPGRALAIAPHVPLLLVAHALGSAFAAMLGQISGGTFAKAADIGADIGARDAGLDDDAAENPATIANLAGDCSGGCASSASSAYAGAALEDAAMMLALAVVYGADETLRSPGALLLLPLLSRVFSILGTAFGALIVRTDDREDPQSPLLRGLVVAAIIHAVGLAGAVEWLLPTRRAPLLGGAAIGILAGALVVPWTHLTTAARFRGVREVAEASRTGPTLGLLAGVGQALTSSIWPIAALGGALVASAALGRAYGEESGELLAVAGLLLGLVGTSTFLTALECAASVVDAASGIVTMTVGRDRLDVRGRLAVLDSWGTSHRAASRALSACAAVPAAFLALHVLEREWVRRALGRAAIEGRPLPHFSSAVSADGLPMLAGIVMGCVLVAWLFARSLLGVVRSSKRIVEEVRRQLRDRPQFEQPSRGREDEARPVDYGPCTEIAARDALRQMVLPGLTAILLPVLLIAGLHLLESEDKGQSAVGSVASLIVAATVAVVLGALFAAGAGGAWGNAKKYIVTGAHGGRLLVDETGARAENPTFVASVVGDTVGDPLKDVAIPFVLVLVKMLPVLALVLLPLLL
jgi:K(+)-stimulated pyrophosphate-energized sodium pump